MSTPKIAQPTDPTAEGSLRDLLGPVTDYKSYIIVFCISTLLTSLALTYVYSEKYLAATTLLFQPQEVTRIRQKETLAFGAPLPIPPFDLIYDNLQLLVQSEPILLEVIEELGLDIEEPVVYQGPWYVQFYQRSRDWIKQLRDDTWTILKHGRIVTDDPKTAALKALRKYLSLIDNNSYFFYLTYIDKDPVRAARVVDTIAAKVVRSLVSRQQEPGIQTRKQLQRLRDAKAAEIEEYQTALETLLSGNNIASVNLETDLTMQRYSELSLEQVQTNAKIASARAKIETLTKQLADQSTRGLQPEDYRRIKSDKLAAEVELRAFIEQRVTVQAALTKLEQQLAKLPALQHKYDTLTQNIKTAQRDFIQISDPYHEADVQANSLLSEITVPHSARVPSVPITPIKIYHVALAGGLALSISFGMAYLLAFARSEHVAKAVSRTVSNMVSMWDGVERRNRNKSQTAYTGPERRQQVEQRSDTNAI